VREIAVIAFEAGEVLGWFVRGASGACRSSAFSRRKIPQHADA